MLLQNRWAKTRMCWWCCIKTEEVQWQRREACLLGATTTTEKEAVSVALQ